MAIATMLFAEQGFDATKVRDITSRAGILSGSLYSHFESKDDMLEEILREYLEEAVAETRRLVEAGGTPEEVLVRIFHMRIGDYQPWHPAFEIIRRESRLIRDSPLLQQVRELARELRQIWIGVFEDGIAAGRFRSDIEPALMHQIATDVFSNYSVWYRPGGKWSPDQILEAQVSVLFRGIVTD